MNRSSPVALASALALSLFSAALAHDPEAEATWRLEQKLKEPWVAAAGFVSDFDAALAAAAKSRKPVFAYFTVTFRPDEACEKLERGILSSPEFRKFGESVVLFVHVESGLPGPHEGLIRDKGGLDAPFFAVLDERGDVTAKVEGTDVKSFEAAVKAGGEFAALKAKADKTADEKVHVLTHEMDIGNLRLLRAKDRIAALGNVTEAQQKRIDEAMFRLEVWTGVSDAGASFEKRRAAGKRFAEMWAAGREPAAEELRRPFFTLILDEAERSKDAKLFKRALAKLEERYGSSQETAWQEFFEENRELLAVMEKAAREREAEKGGGDAK